MLNRYERNTKQRIERIIFTAGKSVFTNLKSGLNKDEFVTKLCRCKRSEGDNLVLFVIYACYISKYSRI